MLTATPAPARPPGGGRFMWLTDDRVLYAGLLGAPTVRAMGCVSVYVAATDEIRMRRADGAWQTGEIAVVPPNVPHEVAADARTIVVLHVEAETVAMAALPRELSACGVVDAPALARHVRQGVCALRKQGGAIDLSTTDFDTRFFGRPLVRRSVDPRIQRVVDAIKRDPATPLAAADCARSVHLSFSRFLHLFKQETGAPFRSFRTWKRARSLLRHVNRDANLAQVALDTGYPDSTHFSHSIRQVYGLKPSDMFAGSRKLAIFGSPLATAF